MSEKGKYLVINPNSSEQMTEDIRQTFLMHSITDVDVISTPESANVLENFADYQVAGANMIKNMKSIIREGDFHYEGALVACMGDPGLYGLKEICPVPVVGIAEAAIATSLLMGYRFSIIAASTKAKPMMESMVITYGMTDHLASVETLGVPIEEFMEDINKLRDGIKRIEAKAMEREAEVLILGCAGMTMLGDEIHTLTKLPIIDPIWAGYWQLKAMVKGGFKISRAGIYA